MLKTLPSAPMETSLLSSSLRQKSGKSTHLSNPQLPVWCTGSRTPLVAPAKPDVFAVLVGKMLLDLLPQSWMVAEINFAANPPAVHTVATSVKKVQACSMA